MHPPNEFWGRPEQVEKFAGRDPDHRLVEIVEGFSEPEATRVLDLGCAAGRNAVYLAERGFDVHALDASEPMVERTRQRLAEVLDPAEAERRASVGTMDHLGAFADDSFELVLALGILHQARSEDEWRRTLFEVGRVLAAGGLLLVASFAPGTDLRGEGVRPVPGEAHVREVVGVGRLYLLVADELDRAMEERGLEPVEPTETVRVDMDPGCRVVVNALYRKAAA
ncbi:MAG: class I SAM-dependent methyltransferase [Candidatus Palauibacterales bacterium]|nr:class I SAM-dependent methyltransferase [Candidatus Palauibacterales bacterium]MDP2530904.1 class I SAM-dependent methyltransferase [Candidatus Palauibacterales bacterium]MDP2582773.1 class I SAM-dependent methyltransferase [Candidatus Palauibacterales bacterium]